MQEFDLTVLGSGPGGYTAAIRAAQLGLKVAIIEKDKLGGVCLNIGCIPTKSLLKDAEILNKLKHLSQHGIKAENISFDFDKIIKRSRDVAVKSEAGVKYLMKKNKITVINGFGKFNKDKTISVYDNENNEIEKVKSKHTIIATGAKPRQVGDLKFDEEKILSSTDRKSVV